MFDFSERFAGFQVCTSQRYFTNFAGGLSHVYSTFDVRYPLARLVHPRLMLSHYLRTLQRWRHERSSLLSSENRVTPSGRSSACAPPRVGKRRYASGLIYGVDQALTPRLAPFVAAGPGCSRRRNRRRSVSIIALAAPRVGTECACSKVVGSNVSAYCVHLSSIPHAPPALFAQVRPFIYLLRRLFFRSTGSRIPHDRCR